VSCEKLLIFILVHNIFRRLFLIIREGIFMEKKIIAALLWSIHKSAELFVKSVRLSVHMKQLADLQTDVNSIWCWSGLVKIANT